MTVVKDKVYAVGGRDQDNADLASVESYSVGQGWQLEPEWEEQR